MKNKKGESLPLNTIILAVLVILVLLSVVVFYIVGWQNMTKKVKGVLGGVIAGEDRILATQLCSKWCEDAKLLSMEERKNSVYCTKSFNVDDDGDGEAEKVSKGYLKYYCHSKTRGYKSEDKDIGRHLGVPCLVGVEQDYICG